MTFPPVSTASAGSPVNVDATGRELLWGQRPMVLAVLFHALVWTLGPALVFGNLHSDTLEAAYWGRDLALGYAKHPPLATWLIDAALRPGMAPLFSLMLLSQMGMALAAGFVWLSIRLYASPRTAALAVLMFLASPAASFYAVQLNHNSLLAPTWAATMYFGLAYLEERRVKHAVCLGVAAALALMTKYEIVFLLVSLVALAVFVPRFRAAFAAPASYICLAVFFVAISPHIWWLESHGWPSASRALGADKIHDVATLNLSAVNGIVGMFTLFAAPAAILFFTMDRRPGSKLARAPDEKLIAQILAFGPPLVLLAGGALTLQILKPLWVLALASSTAAGLALLFRAGGPETGISERFSAKLLMSLSAIIFVALSLYLVAAGWLGKPLAAYSADTRLLSEAIEKLWAEHQPGSVPCVVVSDRKIGPSGVLYLPGRPDFVDFSSPSWATPRQIGECRRSGAIAALAETSTALDNFPSACRTAATRFRLPTRPLMGKVTWPVELVYIPPEGGGATCDAPK